MKTLTKLWCRETTEHSKTCQSIVKPPNIFLQKSPKPIETAQINRKEQEPRPRNNYNKCATLYLSNTKPIHPPQNFSINSLDQLCEDKTSGLDQDDASSTFFRVRSELSDKLRAMYNTACKARAQGLWNRAVLGGLWSFLGRSVPKEWANEVPKSC